MRFGEARELSRALQLTKLLLLRAIVDCLMVECRMMWQQSQQIMSPVKGHVAQLLFHTVGGVVTPAEKLAVIVPVDSPLLLKALVSSRDVGFISPGTDVSIKIDTFEFRNVKWFDKAWRFPNRSGI